MASPFPGMDPYLEGEMWQEFHERFANQISVQLMPLLKPKYVALLAKRYTLNRPALGIIEPRTERVVYPDVHVVQPPTHFGGAAVAEATTVGFTEPTAVVPSIFLEEVPQLSIEIRDVAQRRLVTLIEILSPANKRGEGALEYGQRREEIMQTATHLLEIDLLSKGSRIQLAAEQPKAPYFVYLSRSNRRPYTVIWAVSVRIPLPTVPVPLLVPDPDVALDLQAALNACFDLVGYEMLLDYQADPPSGLEDDDQAWVAETVKKAGFGM